MKKGEIRTGALRAAKVPDCRRHLLLWGSGENFKKLELKYEVSCIFRHVCSKENERVPQQILCKKTEKNTYNHRQLKIILELSLEDFLFSAKVSVLNMDF